MLPCPALQVNAVSAAGGTHKQPVLQKPQKTQKNLHVRCLAPAAAPFLPTPIDACALMQVHM